MRIGFLFNHDQVHQVAHALPIALAMRRLSPTTHVVVATTNPALTAEVHRLAGPAVDEIEIVELSLRRVSTRLLARGLEWALPIRKIGMYRDNLDLFGTLDALVVTEKTSLILKTRYGLNLPIIHTRHGAGDRAIGFNKASAGFDHVLVSGPKIRRRLIDEAGVAPDRISMVGYAKFDLLGQSRPRLPMQDNGKPTVLYNPHPSPHLSSWYVHGRAVLEHFLRDDRFNLIFAPHVMLFHRPFVVTIDKLRIDRPGRIATRFSEAPNIHIDLGSAASTDMSYTLTADIYLGDVSSQIYEFLYRPRPCLFLNSHGVDWRSDPNYAHWAAGPVIGDPAHLEAALDWAMISHSRYAAIQRRLFDDSVDLTPEPSAVRAALAILDRLGAAVTVPETHVPIAV
ncbi:MAG: hypothetical protein ACOY5R_12130 [Pseudomonadota bacterium]|uniref:hypothetical protein n=1 Tax=Rhizorhabdus phycosphaerae TaxID=2711156 RepID=UPI0013ED53D1|nr:hypothetical protein [Rhizorhabdus phycosphaerae]